MRFSGEILKELRRKNGYSTLEAAAVCGIPHGTFNDCELNKHVNGPGYDVVLAMEKGFRVPPGYFATDDPPAPKSKPGRPPKEANPPLSLLPLYGRVAAGTNPCEIERFDGQFLEFRDFFKPQHRHAIYQVSGSSMDKAIIRSRDYVVVRRGVEAAEVPIDELIVAQLAGGLVVKQYAGEKLKSLSFDARHKNIELSDDDPGLLVGVVVAVIRGEKAKQKIGKRGK